MYICLIDYTKAFDTIKHKQLMKILHTLNVDGKDLRIIQKLYWEQTAAIGIKNELAHKWSPYTPLSNRSCLLTSPP